MRKLDKTISEVWAEKYVVPLYQRNFSWTEPQINLLLQDIYDSFKADQSSNYYIGSLVVLRRQDGFLEVIDGQQRLTVLHMLCKVLGIINSPKLSYDSRPEVEQFFDELFTAGDAIDFSAKDTTKIYRLVEGLELIRTTRLHSAPGKPTDKEFYLCDPLWPAAEKQVFIQYLKNKVVLVRIELPTDTDVAAYFEIMNNRGEQLQEHEIIKALLMKNLSKQERGVFSTVWGACSQMNIPIQKALTSYRLNASHPLFGSNYEELHLDYLSYYNDSDGSRDLMDIDTILSTDFSAESVDGEDNEEKYDSIVDFPNFLMHLFKSYDSEIELNDKYLLERYKEVESKVLPMDFLRKLLLWRVRFDKFVVKTVDGDDDEENQKWILRRPYLDGNSLKFRNTYNAEFEKDPSDDEFSTDRQENVIMAESMLQVTFRNRKYKNWLFDLLMWMDLDSKDSIQVPSEELTGYLHQWMNRYYLDNILDKTTHTFPYESSGRDTPHFVFSFIDYLYWIEYKKGKDGWRNNIRYLDSVKDFKFKYYSSVEHHLPQSYEVSREVLDSIGNLCLISKSKNSSLKDKGPTEKAKMIDGLAPKRRIMYEMTNIKKMWDKSSIEEHSKDILNLLEKSPAILGLSNFESV